jgi:hypothetical protein
MKIYTRQLLGVLTQVLERAVDSGYLPADFAVAEVIDDLQDVNDAHLRGWAEGARAAADGFAQCSRQGCEKPARHFYINCNYCDEHELIPTGPAHRR